MFVSPSLSIFCFSFSFLFFFFVSIYFIELFSYRKMALKIFVAFCQINNSSKDSILFTNFTFLVFLVVVMAAHISHLPSESWQIPNPKIMTTQIYGAVLVLCIIQAVLLTLPGNQQQRRERMKMINNRPTIFWTRLVHSCACALC